MTTTIFISASIPIIILIINIIVTSVRDSRKNYDKRIEEKLNRDEFYKEQKHTESRLKKCEDVVDILLDIKVEQAATRNDIAWIRDSISHLNCKEKKKCK